MAQQDAEDVEDVVPVVGESVGVDYGVEVDGEEAGGYEEESL